MLIANFAQRDVKEQKERGKKINEGQKALWVPGRAVMPPGEVPASRAGGERAMLRARLGLERVCAPLACKDTAGGTALP